MRRRELGEVVAEQRFEVLRPDGTTASVLAQVGRPVPDPDSPDGWTCPYRITGLGNERVKATLGLDGMHALSLALHMFPVELLGLAEKEGSTLRYLGQSPVFFGGLCRTLLRST